jgi:hypothetical protein
MALGMESDEAAFHATSLVKFRNRLLKHNLLGIGFDAVLGAMRKAGYLKAHKAQRLDCAQSARSRCPMEHQRNNTRQDQGMGGL